VDARYNGGDWEIDVRLLVFLLMAFTALAQKYSGPVPEKEDLLYLLQADNLIPTEAATAQEQKGKKKDETIYFVPRAASSARTPLASPTFLLKVKDLVPEKLELYKLEVRNGRREITIGTGKRAKGPQPMHMDVKKLADDLVRLQVSESLPNGQYSITPAGSNDVFCFEVY
jgi:hypothetical protein